MDCIFGSRSRPDSWFLAVWSWDRGVGTGGQSGLLDFLDGIKRPFCCHSSNATGP